RSSMRTRRSDGAARRGVERLCFPEPFHQVVNNRVVPGPSGDVGPGLVRVLVRGMSAPQCVEGCLCLADMLELAGSCGDQNGRANEIRQGRPLHLSQSVVVLPAAIVIDRESVIERAV